MLTHKDINLNFRQNGKSKKIKIKSYWILGLNKRVGLRSKEIKQ